MSSIGINGEKQIQGYTPPLTELVLSAKKLRGINLRLCPLDNLDLSEKDLCDADLRGAKFKSTFCFGTKFRHAKLYHTELTNICLERADFRGADLRGAIFHGSNLRSALFHGAQLDGADFTKADLAYSSLCPNTVGTNAHLASDQAKWLLEHALNFQVDATWYIGLQQYFADLDKEIYE